MTIETELSKVTYTGNGVTTNFPFTFTVQDEDHLQVTLRDTVTEVNTLLSASAYSVSGVPGTGSVTYNPSGTPIPSTKQLILNRVVPYKQEMDIENQGGFYPEVLEDQLDNIVMQIQQLAEESDRAVHIPLGADEAALDELVEDILRLNTSADNIDIVAGISGDVTAVADIAADVTTVAGIASYVPVVAAIDDDVTTVAGIAADVTTAADNMAAIIAAPAEAAAAAASADEAEAYAANLGNALPLNNAPIDSAIDWDDISTATDVGWHQKLLGPNNPHNPLANSYFHNLDMRYNNTMTQLAFPYGGAVDQGIFVRGQTPPGGAWYSWRRLTYSHESVYLASSRTVMTARNRANALSTYLSEAGREGHFVWNGANLSGILLGSSITSSAVNSGTETITSSGHGLKTGHAVIVTAAVNGLSTNTLYYVIYVDANNFKLASSHANAVAGTAFNLTGTSAMTVKQHFDPEQGIYVCPTTNISGAAGADVRAHEGEFHIEWFGGLRNNTSYDNKQAHDGALATLRATGFNTLVFQTGVYTYLTAPHKHTFGIKLKGKGYGSSLLNGTTNLERRFNMTSLEVFLGWDGTGIAYNSTGGGIERLNVLAADGYTGGKAVQLYATSDSQRPGYMEFSHFIVWGTGSGTWQYCFEQDGSNCTTGSGQGLRDVAFTDVYLCCATAETAQFNNATNNTYNGLYVYQAGGSASILRISGTDSTSYSRSTNAKGTIFVSGTLILDYCDYHVLTGYATEITITDKPKNCKIYMDCETLNIVSTTRYALAITNNTHIFDRTVMQPTIAAATGAVYHPDGTMEAWGYASLTSSASTITYGVTFGVQPNVQLTVVNASAAYGFLTGSPGTTSVGAAANVAGPVTVLWKAVGRAP